MMRTKLILRNPGKWPAESGQINIYFILIMGLFFLAFLGLAVDYANFWFHRRAAQGAADAACQAGAMDLLVNATNGSSLGGFPSPVANYNCIDFPNSAPCKYATLNGYPSATLVANTPGTDVKVSFPGSVTGVTTPPASIAPTPFIKVNVDDEVATYFSGLISGKRTQSVGAAAVCGLQQAKAPIPIIVLNPTCQHSFQVGDAAATLTIVGGPNKSVQVNSSNTTCASATSNSQNSCSGNATIDLSQGGPNFTGSTFGSFGGPTTAPTNFKPGTTGGWVSPSSPIADPFSRVGAPTVPAAAPASKPVAFHVDGCPDNQGCTEYFPGQYTVPIVVKNTTAIFVPGLYYIKPSSFSGASNGGYCGTPGSGCTAKPTGNCNADLLVDSGGIVRLASNSATNSDTSKGIVFYLSGSTANGFGSAVFTANAGSSSGADLKLSCPATGKHCIESVPATAMTCDGSTPDSRLNMPSAVNGNVLMGQCTSGGTYIGTGSTDTIPTNLANATRGLIFFQDRANGNANGQANMQGGGGLVISGTVYAHNCPNNPTCDPVNDYKAFFDLAGGSGSGTFVIGEIVADQLIDTGSSAISMTLNPKAVLFILKAELLQ